MQKAFWGIVIVAAVFGCAETALGMQGGAADLPDPSPAPTRPSGPNRSLPPRTGHSPTVPSSRVPAQLTVISRPPGCSVLLDGLMVGTTDHEGVLQVSKITPGRSVIVVRNDRYRETQTSVQLMPGESRSLSVSLVPLPGRLIVNSDVSGTHIEVRGVGSYIDSIPGLELAPGTYRITLSSFGYTNVALDVGIEPGGTFRLGASLAPLTIDELASQVEEEFNSGRYDRVIAACQRMLAEAPDSPGVNLMLGASYFRTGRYRESVDPLATAVKSGQLITIPVRLENRSSRDEYGPPCSGYLVLTKSGFGFRAFENRPEVDFFIPLDKVLKVQPAADRMRIGVGVGGRDRVRFAIDNVLDISSGIISQSKRKNAESDFASTSPNAGPEKRETYDVYPIEASPPGAPAPDSSEVAEYRANSAAVEVLFGVLERLRR